jgi:integrase
MGTVYKKTFTKPLPEGAEMFSRNGQQFARWKPPEGRTRTAPVTTGRDGSLRILIKSNTYVAFYRDGSGKVVERSTRCRDEGAARSVLTELERRAELVRAGVISAGQDAVAEQQDLPLADHIVTYVEHLKAKRVSESYRQDSKSYLVRIATECRFIRLSDLDRSALERWLAARAEEGLSARACNAYRGAAVSFCNWCLDTRRLVANPFERLAKANQRVDRRRERRALTEEELHRLLEAARRRPLLMREARNRGPRKGAPGAKLKEGTRSKLELLGHERALIYKTLVLTGLRRGELASLTVAQLELDGPQAWAIVHAADEKARRGAQIPLRADLASDLRAWLRRKLECAQAEAKRRGEPIPMALSPQTPLFNVPEGLVKILDRDLELAGIPKRDGRGRTIDVHAMRHTFGTHLSKGGVPLRTAQSAMRHSDPRLTANVYTDPQLLDIAGALDALPVLPIGGSEPLAEAATGTHGGDPACSAACGNFRPTETELSISGNPEASGAPREAARETVLSSAPDSPCQPLSAGVKNRGDRIRTYDLLVPNQAL